jgi:hypothetical protein
MNAPDIREVTRNFDRNMRAASDKRHHLQRARLHRHPEGWFAGPETDPHGRRWRDLTKAELEEVAGWCMLPEFHRALEDERAIRRATRGRV